MLLTWIYQQLLLTSKNINQIVILEILTNESHYVKSLCHYVRPWDMLGNCCMTFVFSFHECLCSAHYVLYPPRILFLGISSVCFTNDLCKQAHRGQNSKKSQNHHNLAEILPVLTNHCISPSQSTTTFPWITETFTVRRNSLNFSSSSSTGSRGEFGKNDSFWTTYGVSHFLYKLFLHLRPFL